MAPLRIFDGPSLPASDCARQLKRSAKRIYFSVYR
jgi:hypothetical protein